MGFVLIKFSSLLLFSYYMFCTVASTMKGAKMGFNLAQKEVTRIQLLSVCTDSTKTSGTWEPGPDPDLMPTLVRCTFY